MQEEDSLLRVLFCNHAKVSSLLCHPIRAGLSGDAAEVNFPALNIDEEQDEAVSEARLGEDTTGDEVTGPDGLGVTLDELSPRTASMFRPRIESIFEKYLLNGCAGDFDPEGFEFTLDASEAPIVLTSHLQDQLYDFIRRLGAAILAPLTSFLCVSLPAEECCISNDGDQVAEPGAQLLAGFE